MRPRRRVLRSGALLLLAAAGLLRAPIFADYPESAYTDFSSKRYRSFDHHASLSESELLSRMNLDSEVRGINASGSRLSDAGLEIISQFKEIDFLRLQRTQITDAGLTHLSSLGDLRYLDLSYSQVGDAGMEHLSGLERLEVLMLSGTQVGDQGMAALSELRNIRYLVAPDLISDRALEQIGRLPELTHLHLHGSRLTDQGLVHLQDLEKLQVLTLPPRVTEEGLASLRRLRGLKEVRLWMYSLSDVGLEALEHLDQMEVLNFDDIQFNAQREPLYYLRKMSRLRLLHAHAYELTDRGTEYLKLMPRLEHLAVRSIALSHDGVANFEGLRKLKYFTFSENNSAEKGVIAALKKALPRAHVSDPVDMSVFRAPVDGGFHNPNKIEYDKRYYEEYVKFVREAAHIDGPGTFSLMTEQGLVEFHAGLDYAYLGRNFHAGQLIAFLQTRRAGGKDIYNGFLQDPLLNSQPLPTPYLRDVFHSIQILGDARAKQSVPILTELLSDESEHLRIACLWSLMKIGEDAASAVPQIIRAMEDPKLAPTASDALAKIGQGAVPHLRKAVHSESVEVRIYSAKALGDIGPAAAPAVPDLVEAIHAERNRVGRSGYAGSYAAEALGKIGDPSVLPDLRKNLNAKNHDLRRASQAAIEKIEARRDQEERLNGPQ